MDAEQFNNVHRALAEPKRVEILETIRKLDSGDGIACTCVLAEMSVSQSTFSHHVSELFKAGLITERKVGRFSMLSVNEPTLSTYLLELQKKILGENRT